MLGGRSSDEEREMVGGTGRFAAGSLERHRLAARRAVDQGDAEGLLPVERFASREAAVRWAQSVVAGSDSVFLDTETTGLDGAAEVVDIAVVASNGRVLLDTLVRPRRQIPLTATLIHGIRDEHVISAPAWPEVVDHLVAILRERHVVVYNAAFDRRLVNQCCAAHGLPVVARDWSCAMMAFAAFHGEWNARRSGYRWHKLEVAVGRFGGQPGGHRALGDAMACRAVVNGMAAMEDDGQ